MPYDLDPRQRMSLDYGGPDPVVVEDLETGARAAYFLTTHGSRVAVSKVVVTHDGRGVSGRDLRSSSPALVVEVFEREFEHQLTDPDFIRAQDFFRRLALKLADANGWGEELRQKIDMQDRSWEDWGPAIKRLLKMAGAHPSREERLALVASTYTLALSNRVRGPNRHVASVLGITPLKVTEDLRAARRAGFLSEAPRRGVPGGVLMPRARDVLDGLASRRSAASPRRAANSAA